MDQTTWLLVFNVGRLQRINDTYGHELGDFLLDVLRRELPRRISDVAGQLRLGGADLVLRLHRRPETEILRGEISECMSEVRRECRAQIGDVDALEDLSISVVVAQLGALPRGSNGEVVVRHVIADGKMSGADIHYHVAELPGGG